MASANRTKLIQCLNNIIADPAWCSHSELSQNMEIFFWCEPVIDHTNIYQILVQVSTIKVNVQSLSRALTCYVVQEFITLFKTTDSCLIND